jgi:DNA-binding transcriptional LysR family regulator
LLALRSPVDARRPGRPFPAIEFGSIEAARRILLASDAIAGVSLSMVAKELSQGSLVLLGTAPWSYIHYGVVSLKGQAQSEPGSRFLRELLETETRMVDDEARLKARFVRERSRKVSDQRPRASADIRG